MLKGQRLDAFANVQTRMFPTEWQKKFTAFSNHKNDTSSGGQSDPYGSFRVLFNCWRIVKEEEPRPKSFNKVYIYRGRRGKKEKKMERKKIAVDFSFLQVISFVFVCLVFFARLSRAVGE